LNSQKATCWPCFRRRVRRLSLTSCREQSTPRCLHVYAFSVSLQYGEIVDVNLVRDRETGKSKGFAFIAFEDQRSTVLAVDNLSGARVVGRTVRVEHVDDYKLKRKEARRAGMCVAVERQTEVRLFCFTQVEQQGGVLGGVADNAAAGPATGAGERIDVPDGATLEETQFMWGGAGQQGAREAPTDAGPAGMDDAAILAAVRARKKAAEAAAAAAAAGSPLPPPPPQPALAASHRHDRDDDDHRAAKRARKEAKKAHKEAKRDARF